MQKFLSIISCFLILFVISIPRKVHCEDNNRAVSELLGTAETFFLSLRTNDYKTAWNLLSKKSHETIVNDVYKASRKIGANTTRENIYQDFDNSGIIFQNYWKAFIEAFDPDLILENSRWEIAFINKTKAEIIITHKKAEAPAQLKLFREDNAWKIGLVETFWTRKL